MLKRKLAVNDHLVFEFLKDQQYRVDSVAGNIEKRIRAWDQNQYKPLWKKIGFKDSKGYYQLRYKQKSLNYARIIFASHHGYLRKHLVINHIDGNPLNNRIENLELVSDSENAKHAYRLFGYRPHNHKLSWNQVDEIKKSWNTGQYTQTKLAEKYGVHKCTINRVVTGKFYVNEGSDG